MGQAKKNVYQLVLLQKEMEEFIRESALEGKRGTHAEQVHIPHIDVYETEKYLHMDIDLPGVEKSDVSCYVTSEQVFIEAIKPASRPSKSAKYYCIERFFGRFRRVIEIPATVNTIDAEAKFEDGLLRIRFPKITDRRQKRRKIEIK